MNKNLPLAMREISKTRAKDLDSQNCSSIESAHGYESDLVYLQAG